MTEVTEFAQLAIKQLLGLEDKSKHVRWSWFVRSLHPFMIVAEQTTLTEKEVTQLCRYTIPLLLDDGMVCNVAAPVRIIGDLHGQFFDLRRQLEKGLESLL